MYWKYPGAIPGKVDTSGFTENPRGSQPFPYPSGLPVAVWHQTPDLVFTTTGLPVGIIARAEWSSPPFDLRPEFRGLFSNTTGSGSFVSRADPSAAPSARAQTGRFSGVQPIWLPKGGTGKLWVQVSGMTTRPWSTNGLRVYATEYANIVDPNDLQQVTPTEDITTEFVGRDASSIAQFIPTGAGYPVRFYRVKFRFDYTVSHSGQPGWPNPGFRLTAAYY